MTEPFDPSCIFCRIIRGEADRDGVFWDDEVAICMLDIRPAREGHSLVIPKAHYPTLIDLPAELLGPLFERAQLVNRAVEIAFDAEPASVILDVAAGQNGALTVRPLIVQGEEPIAGQAAVLGTPGHGVVVAAGRLSTRPARRERRCGLL